MSTERYWQAAADGRLEIPSCRSCGRAHHPPRAWCPHCRSTDLEWIEATGAARLISFSVVHQGPEPDLETPYVLAIVELAEGPRMMTNVVDVPYDELTFDMPVRVAFVERGERTLPVFTA